VAFSFLFGASHLLELGDDRRGLLRLASEDHPEKFVDMPVLLIDRLSEENVAFHHGANNRAVFFREGVFVKAVEDIIDGGGERSFIIQGRSARFPT